MGAPRRTPATLALLAGLVALCAAPARGQAPVPVAARDLPRGAVLERADIAPPPGADTSAVVPRLGWVTRRVVAAGEPLRPPSVAPPELVRAGQVVQAVWAADALEIRLVGRAMGAGAVGERVVVRVDTQRRFEGIVAGPALVRIQSPGRSGT